MTEEDAATVVSRSLRRIAPAERGRFLRSLLAHAAAGLQIIEGQTDAAMALYQLADALVVRGGGHAGRD